MVTYVYLGQTIEGTKKKEAVGSLDILSKTTTSHVPIIMVTFFLFSSFIFFIICHS
jgi:hypothetical protein